MVVDLDNNRVEFLPEDIPALPEVEGRQLRESLLQLAHPALVRLDLVHSTNSYLRRFSKPWCQDHDAELRYVQLINVTFTLLSFRYMRVYVTLACKHQGKVQRIFVVSSKLVFVHLMSILAVS